MGFKGFRPSPASPPSPARQSCFNPNLAIKWQRESASGERARKRGRESESGKREKERIKYCTAHDTSCNPITCLKVRNINRRLHGIPLQKGNTLGREGKEKGKKRRKKWSIYRFFLVFKKRAFGVVAVVTKVGTDPNNEKGCKCWQIWEVPRFPVCNGGTVARTHIELYIVLLTYGCVVAINSATVTFLASHHHISFL